jgi:hypothetical protein
MVIRHFNLMISPGCVQCHTNLFFLLCAQELTETSEANLRPRNGVPDLGHSFQACPPSGTGLPDSEVSASNPLPPLSLPNLPLLQRYLKPEIWKERARPLRFFGDVCER